ncbi:ATP-grasp domain protein [Candidatus Bilamarchaeum dharawalense]|uniref:ATP-grasp domain protein n=1 Tax=Candidatus Bilamarchaeum dharawalense TaxID=2885759 RepID=A0A5E4LU82_9ARCH|nr:ATP-grasp domain protein [Candidatus Bilamarchaeum dharawalense]
MIVLVDGAFVSDILVETCVKYEIPIYAANKQLKTKIRSHGRATISIKQAKKVFKNGERAYTSAESVLPIVHSKIVDVFKNKFLFRTILSSFPEYRDFFFRELSKEELANFQPSKKVVLKPSRGFFSLGVRVCLPENFNENAKGAVKEVENATKTYPSATLKEDKWIVEEYITGKEFAVDAYFDKQGNPVVNAVYYHPFSDEMDTRDLLYYSNKRIMKEQVPKVKLFLTRLRDAVSSSSRISNFPLHMEYRIRNGVVYPIEINPWRFGGFGLSDLPAVWGLNQYERFFGLKTNEKAEMKDGINYAFILCRNPVNLSDNQRYQIDHEGYRKMLKDLEIEVKQYHKFDYKKFGVASVANCEAFNERKMVSLLKYDTSPHYLPV